MPDEALGDDLLDLAAFAELRTLSDGRGGDLSERFVTLFLDEAAAMTRTLQAAVSAGAGGEVALTAHALSGAAGFVGARRVVAAARAIERAADAGESAALAGLVARLEAELASLRPALLRALAEPPA